MEKCLIEINSSTVGSTGRIMFMMAESARLANYKVYTSSAKHGNERKIESTEHIYIGNKWDKKMHLILAKATGCHGMFSRFMTKRFLKRMDNIKPQLIHIHNLHNCYINIPMLFAYIKKHKIPVVWTLHDCWSYTGHCPYYDFAGCEKWKVECHSCEQLQKYPYSSVDHSRQMYHKKKEWFLGANLTLVTPSKWLAKEVEKSFLKEYPVKVIHNGIDLDIFCPTPSEVRKKYQIEDKVMVLGVAGSWTLRKGVDVFEKLAKDLPKEYQIVLVGVNEKQKGELPSNIIAISHTNHQQELAQLYTAADVFVMPTREDNFPTTNIEALACGTGVITYQTGGSPEIITSDTGVVVEKENYEMLKRAIINVKQNPFDSEACRNRAMKFDRNKAYQEYVQLFDSIVGGELSG